MWLLVEHPLPTLYINDDVVIFGNMFIAKSDEEGETIGLDDDEMKMLNEFVTKQKPKLKQWLSNPWVSHINISRK